VRIRRSTSAGAGLIATVTLVLMAAPAPAADAPAGPNDLPPRISAVLEPDKPCTRASKAGVTVASAAHRILIPASAWQLTRGQGVTVAVLDTGFSTGSSPQLDGQVKRGEDVVRGGRTRDDCTGHGTFVAGLIAARARTGTTVVGIAPQAHVYSVTVTDKNGATSPDVLAKGINAAVGAGIKIIDVSVVSPRSSAKLEAAVKNARSRGALVFAPAAADDQDLDGPVYPATLPGVISVSNSTTTENASADSGSGSTKPLVEADLAAPGDVLLSVGPGGGAFVGSGTAYATALVAGTAALMDSYRPGLTLAQREHRLTETAYPSAQGAAVVDPYSAVSTILPGEDGAIPAPPPARVQVAAMPPPVLNPVWYSSLTLAAIAVLAVLVALGAVATVTRGRARGWTPRTAPLPEDPPRPGNPPRFNDPDDPYTPRRSRSSAPIQIWTGMAGAGSRSPAPGSPVQPVTPAQSDFQPAAPAVPAFPVDQ
jgi:membrane-anchored mycosin MYCP